ncbi:radical SAM protein [Candidatus Dojkabacteria bacterium]|jgi:hypothetical protein|nr:radical SAM protein [Candidatus Dojkabacteria bacterium]
MELYDIGDIRKFRSTNCNFNFNRVTGYTEVWGRTEEENPDYLPYGPMIADIEITTSCGGPKGIPCPFCYKGNTKNGKNMSLETFKQVFHKLPKTVTQIAFGADADLSSNPDVFDIMHYCRNNDYNYVVPNVTVADVNTELAEKLSAVCGAVAVSRYADKGICYDSVNKLTDQGMKQVNIHMMLSEETFDQAVETIFDIRNDKRLGKLNAIVFLSLKTKGRGKHFHKLSEEKFSRIIYLCMMFGVRYGFDSCSANKFLKAVEILPNYKELEQMAEPCESTLFSTYIDVEGKFYPCSFCENVEGWEDGLDVVNCTDFLKDIWLCEKTFKFREKLLSCGRNCPIYNV